MSEICSGIRTGDGFPSGGSQGAARHLIKGLRLAAAPTFVMMALLAAQVGDDGVGADVLCLAADHASPFGGMVPMYLLMSVFHLPPWLKLLFGRVNGTSRA